MTPRREIDAQALLRLFTGRCGQATEPVLRARVRPRSRCRCDRPPRFGRTRFRRIHDACATGRPGSAGQDRPSIPAPGRSISMTRSARPSSPTPRTCSSGSSLWSWASAATADPGIAAGAGPVLPHAQGSRRQRGTGRPRHPGARPGRTPGGGEQPGPAEPDRRALPDAGIPRGPARIARTRSARTGGSDRSTAGSINPGDPSAPPSSNIDLRVPPTAGAGHRAGPAPVLPGILIRGRDRWPASADDGPIRVPASRSTS